METGKDVNGLPASGGTASMGQVRKSLDIGTTFGHRKTAQQEVRGMQHTSDVKDDREAAAAAQEIRKIRAPRTRRYIQELAQADQPGENDTKIMEAVRALPVNNRLAGILAECTIEGCIIHAIDRMGNILEHYRSEEEIPEELKPGYPVYEKYPGCVSVEVYTQWFCVTREDGSVKFISREEM